MNKLTTAMFAGSLAFFAFASNVSAECSFFYQENYEGEGGKINPNDFVRFFEEKEADGLPYEVREAKAPVYHDASHSNKVKSIKLTNGCEAIVYKDKSMNSGMTVFKSDTPNTEASLNGKAASLFCRCKK